MTATKGPGAHSRIGASSAKRWWTCPGSVRLCANVPNTSSPAAREGTAAHQVGEDCLNPTTIKWPRPAAELVGDVIDVDGEGIVVTDEMAEAVQVYLDTVAGWVARDKDAVVHVESRFHLVEFHEDLFGTNDVAIWLPNLKLFVVLDYKHGKGQYVEARGNLQTRYYALGGLVKYGYPATQILSGIVQPRCPQGEAVRYDDPISPVDLLDWAADLVAAAKATEAADAPLVPGDHCRETFCGAYAICPAAQAKAKESVALEFGGPVADFYDPAKLAEALELAGMVEGWAKAVNAFALAEAEAGRCPPGWKLVEKRATRKWADPAAAKAFLLEHLDASKVVEEKIVTPAAAEKLLKPLKTPLPDPLVSKESSGYTLAAEDDKRPAITRGGEFPVA